MGSPRSKEWIVNVWHKNPIKSFAVPGGLLLLGMVLLLRTTFVPLPASAVEFYYVATFSAGLLLAWRFHSSRSFFLLLTLLLAERVLVFFSTGRPINAVVVHNAFAAIALLIPFNLVAFSFLQERGFTAPSSASRLLLILLQSIFVAIVSRPGQSSVLRLLDPAIVNRHWLAWTRLPQPSLVAFAAAFAVLVLRFVRLRKPLESGLFWSLLSVYLALDAGGIGRLPTAYLGSAALILVVALVETSYLMAYHDELTALPARRAFNEVIVGLENQYAIAIVDVDHFKRFNDTYGHETGDHVLRMVAAQLAQVTGGGKAFRCGGEEFSIVFPGKSSQEAVEHLELLREAIGQSKFMVRSVLERRSKPRGSDRRKKAAKKRATIPRRPRRSAAEEVSVTVSIGVAEPSTKNRDVEQVIRAADSALYRAKEGGRNRVEIDGPAGKRLEIGTA
jgi:diguanylate cyclase (GGDEF)-like protein